MTPRNTVYITTTRTIAGVSDLPQLSASSAVGALRYVEQQAQQYGRMGYTVKVTKGGKRMVAQCSGVVIEIEVGQ